MLNIVIGQKKNVLAADRLIEVLRDVDLNGTLYLGYPVIASVDETFFIDGLLTCQEHGVVVFHFDDRSENADGYDELKQKQDDIYAAVSQKYMNFKPLRQGRALAFNINVVTLAPQMQGMQNTDDLQVTGPDSLIELIQTFEPIDEELLWKINAATQRVSTIKPVRKRSSVKSTTSRGAIMKEIEKEIANLDKWQNGAAIEYPEGPQRIRGLAGSGKTVVLALKAAYLYASNPDWRIALTFQTRSLYQQFLDLVRRFIFEHSKEEPDFGRLQIIHAWGSSTQPGLYSIIAQANGIKPRDFLYGRQTFGYESAFEGVCQELLNEVGEGRFKQLYDAILIDEAQDFPHSFFETAYLAAKQPKRIVYAYDELQNLGAYSMAPPSELFGKDRNGLPRVPELRNEQGAPRQDIMLPVCYRNTPWALTIAHALGFGIYRDGGLVQFFDSPSLWSDVGYHVVAGTLAQGQDVSLERRRDSYPRYFERLLDPQDVVVCKVFNNKAEQAKELAKSIRDNLAQDELEFRDILVILSDAYTARSEAGLLIQELAAQGIPAHLAGVTSSRDELFNDESIAISGIYRAKGNEAPMVYVLNSDYGYQGLELNKRRNTLFTAITRSRGWIRIFGCGSAMEGLKAEVDQVVASGYKLKFKVPTSRELERMRKIHRDMTPQERKKIEETVSDFASLVERGDIAPENIPPELRAQLEEWFRQHSMQNDA
jgi:superfamily I DNA and RNA helicase